METFRDQKTNLIFPQKVGAWTRYDITTHPIATAGYSVIYQLHGWFGGCKAQLSVDVYNKGLPYIPSGPHSPCVAIELQNIMHAMFPKSVRAVDASRIDAYLAGSADADKELGGKIDSAEVFRLDNGEGEMRGKKVLFVVFVTAHRDHFVKVQIIDLKLGESADQIRDFMRELSGQIKADQN